MATPSLQTLPYDILRVILEILSETDAQSFTFLSSTCRTLREVYLSNQPTFVQELCRTVFGQQDENHARVLAENEHPELKVEHECRHTYTPEGKKICHGPRPEFWQSITEFRLAALREFQPVVKRLARFLRAYECVELRIRRHTEQYWGEYDDEEVRDNPRPRPLEHYISAIYVHGSDGKNMRFPGKGTLDYNSLIHDMLQVCTKWLMERYKWYARRHIEDRDGLMDNKEQEDPVDKRFGGDGWNEFIEGSYDQIMKRENWKTVAQLFGVEDLDLEAWEFEATKPLLDSHIASAVSLMNAWKRERQFKGWGPGQPLRLYFESVVQEDSAMREDMHIWIDTPRPVEEVITVYYIADSILSAVLELGPQAVDTAFALSQTCSELRERYSRWNPGGSLENALKTSMGEFYEIGIELAKAELGPEAMKRDNHWESIAADNSIWSKAWGTHKRVVRFAKFLQVVGRLSNSDRLEERGSASLPLQLASYVNVIYAMACRGYHTRPVLIQRLGKLGLGRAVPTDEVEASLRFILQRPMLALASSGVTGSVQIYSNIWKTLLVKVGWRKLDRVCGVSDVSWLWECEFEDGLRKVEEGSNWERYKNEWMGGERMNSLLLECLSFNNLKDMPIL